MSVITRFSVYSHCNNIGGKVWNPAIKWTHKFAVFVLLEDEQGVSGLGECWCFDSAPDSLVAFLKTEVSPHILGKSVDEAFAHLQRLVAGATLTARHGMLASALSGVDIALWDVASQSAGKPLWQYLQAQMTMTSDATGQAFLYASGGLYGEGKTQDDLVTELCALNAEGFSIVKMKVGGMSLSEDVQRVLAVLNSLDDSCKLIIDGVYMYSKAQAQVLYSELPAHRIEAFQSPTKARDLGAMQELTATSVPVMATEAEYRTEIHDHMIQNKTVRYLQVAPVACGGLSRLNELANAITASDIDSGTTAGKIELSLEVSSTAVALLAASHFAAANKLVAHTEYHSVHQVFFDDLDLARVEGMQGWFQLPDKPGLGMSLPISSVKCELTLEQ